MENFNKIPNQNLPELQEKYKKRFEEIFNNELTVDNIDSFADDALDDILAMVDDALREYENNPVLEGDMSLSKQEREDKVAKKLNLPDIGEILDLITQKKEQIDSLKEKIRNNKETIDKIIVPTDENAEGIVKGNGGFETKDLHPRLLTLAYILETNFGISPDELEIKEGIVTSDMIREEPYVRVLVRGLERVIYVCDEEDNASYIFDTNKLEKQNINMSELDLMTKEERNKLIQDHQGIGIRIIQTKNWTQNITDQLQGISTIDDDSSVSNNKTESEFRKKKKEWPEFKDFEREVRNLYPGKGRVDTWYREEYKKHNNWPSAPDMYYKDKGWKGWSELVGKENPNKKEWLEFEDFKQEVRNLYPGEGNVFVWYRKERKKHSDWPSTPNKVYKDKGWEGWPELVGKED